MAKHVRLIETEVINFAGLRSKKVEYGDVTRLSGKNGQGKTSIGTAPVWTMYGTDLFGNKYNPSPTNYEFDRVFASTILQVDGVPIKFAREIENGTNSFYINDVPTKAKEFEAAVAELFDKDEFLSFYNPIYFFGRHWTKQREQIMKYTTQPAKKDVFQEMSRKEPDQKPKEITLNPAAEKLNELMKKHTLDDLQKIHGGTGGRSRSWRNSTLPLRAGQRRYRSNLINYPQVPVKILSHCRLWKLNCESRSKWLMSYLRKPTRLKSSNKMLHIGSKPNGIKSHKARNDSWYFTGSD